MGKKLKNSVVIKIVLQENEKEQPGTVCIKL